MIDASCFFKTQLVLKHFSHICLEKGHVNKPTMTLITSVILTTCPSNIVEILIHMRFSSEDWFRRKASRTAYAWLQMLIFFYNEFNQCRADDSRFFSNNVLYCWVEIIYYLFITYAQTLKLYCFSLSSFKLLLSSVHPV